MDDHVSPGGEPTAPRCRQAPAARSSDASSRAPVAAPMPPLSAEERRILVEKGTEPPFTGRYWNTFDPGVYVCRRCGATLYQSEDKFDAPCGWPSFDAESPGAVRRRRDADGVRTEILCAACGAHLGHVFNGEGFTEKNVRHCVNSASLVLVANRQGPRARGDVPGPVLERAFFAGGCFWGVEHQFQQVPGVKRVTSGFSGGHTRNPTYQEVCAGTTGHAETVEVVFNPDEVSYESLARRFFEIHDPEQVGRQGPDVGGQYRSAVFYTSETQKRTAEDLIEQLRAIGYRVATEVAPATTFWPAEPYHQDYYARRPGRACGRATVPRFDRPKR